MSRPELDAIDAALRGEPVDGEHAALALLVDDVRASAPRMSPELERRLEAIPDPRTEPRRSLRWIAAPAAATLCAALIGIAVYVDSQPRTGLPTSSSEPAETQPAAGQSAAQDEAAPLSRQAAPTAPALPSTAAPGRRVQRNVALALAAAPDDFTRVADEIVRTTDRFGGIVQRSTVEAAGENGSASFDLRIPSARLDDALAALSRLAHVRSRSAATEDVTRQFVSAADRLADARAERRALLRALSRATTEAQAARLRLRLREVRERIGRARAEVERLRRSTSLSRVSVTVTAAREAADEDGGAWTPADALRDAGRVLEVAAGVVLVGLAVVAPLALLGALAYGAVRVSRRRRREAALEA